MDTSTLGITWAGSLRGQVAAIETRRFLPEEQRVTVADLLDAVETHLATRGAKALTSFACHLKPVRALFRGIRAIDVTSTQADQYVADRVAAGRARATINRELGGLKQAFRLAVKQERLARAPYLPWLREDNARQGFFEQRRTTKGDCSEDSLDSLSACRSSEQPYGSSSRLRHSRG